MTVAMVLGFVLILLGLWAMLSRRNIIKIIIGFSIIDTGVHVTMVAVGYLRGRTAPILDSANLRAEALTRSIDPLPSALVLTAIVIGLAVTALMLSYALRLHRQTGSLSIDTMKDAA